MSSLSVAEFIAHLSQVLPFSTGKQRRQWAQEIIENSYSLKKLVVLLNKDARTANHFLWLLSDVGVLNKHYLQNFLPWMLTHLKTLPENYRVAMASYWYLVGVPEENEGEAIDNLFQWLLSNKVNSSIKSRAIWVLVQLSKKHPEIIPEFLLCLESSVDSHTADFQKRVRKTIALLQSKSTH